MREEERRKHQQTEEGGELCDKNPPTPCLWQAPANNKPPPPPCAVAKLNKEPTDKKKKAHFGPCLAFGPGPWGKYRAPVFFTAFQMVRDDRLKNSSVFSGSGTAPGDTTVPSERALDDNRS